MTDKKQMDDFMSKYYALAKKCKRENRLIFNHLCIRVEDIEMAEEMMAEAFGLTDFIRPGGDLFEGEKDLSVTWLNDEVYMELMQTEEKQKIGYDTGSAQPIGHLSEIGFFTPDLDRELERLGKLGWNVTTSVETHGGRMCKIDTDKPSGFPVELIDIDINSLDD